MNLDNFKFTTKENEEGFTVTITGDKSKIKAKLEAFEAFLNFKEKAKQAGCVNHDSDSPFHQFIKTMHKHHAQHREQHFNHGHSGCNCNDDGAVNQTDENKTSE